MDHVDILCVLHMYGHSIDLCFEYMKPFVKYQGGKTKELPIIKQLLPDEFDKVVAPFCGGAAVSFNLQKPCILNDVNDGLINAYNQIKDKIEFQEVFSEVCHCKPLDHDALSDKYFEARDYLNGDERDPYKWAVSYIIVRQLCFSGMERYNSKGQFNVPFGHYKKFSCNLNWEHMQFLQNADITSGDFYHAFVAASNNDWIFIDPPYRARAGYTTGDGGEDLHERLVAAMKETTAPWLFVHTEDDFYKRELKDYHIIYKDFGYSQRWGKGKNHANASVSHMYVTNYENDMTLHALANPNLLEVCT